MRADSLLIITPPNVLWPAIHWDLLLTHRTGTCSWFACLLSLTIVANTIYLRVGFESGDLPKGPIAATERRAILVFVDDVADPIIRWAINWYEDGLCPLRQIKVSNFRRGRLSPLFEV